MFEICFPYVFKFGGWSILFNNFLYAVKLTWTWRVWRIHSFRKKFTLYKKWSLLIIGSELYSFEGNESFLSILTSKWKSGSLIGQDWKLAELKACTHTHTDINFSKNNLFFLSKRKTGKSRKREQGRWENFNGTNYCGDLAKFGIIASLTNSCFFLLFIKL